jgi:glycogen operon protein
MQSSGADNAAWAGGAGVVFALAAPNAQSVDLCLFDATGKTQTACWAMPECRNGAWQGFLPNAAAGLVFGWRVHGPWKPEEGFRFNPNKVLLDPYAQQVVGQYDGNPLHLGYQPEQALQQDTRDNAAVALKAVVVPGLPAPRPLAEPVAPARRVLYEMHVKAFTARHPMVPEALRGTYAGLAHPAAVAHLKSLGVTTVSLMPVAHRADEPRLLAMGLVNHWGYNPVAWNAPEARYWSGTTPSPRHEFLQMVDTLHAAGLEVVLDVVYNHTAESDEWGPTFNFRGIDNALYYHLLPHDKAGYINWSGCGNCVNLGEPLVLRTVLDSLRHWVQTYGVDGFRFDLAPILARAADRPGHHAHHFQPNAPLLAAIAQDPLLRHKLMIAEPWDIGPGGYQMGGFPTGWLEWNDRFRDTQRKFWLHHGDSRGNLANRLAGSSDVFGHGRRGAHSSVNFVTAHDGFTLRDLVSYSRRHNHANGEENRDGHGQNHSVNNGIEGPTDQPEVLALRGQQQRALLACTVWSLGTPMILSGDEIGHSQGGNNNAYCQDNTITWLDWDQADMPLAGFVSAVLAWRRKLPVLQAHDWWGTERNNRAPQASWFNAHGDAMTHDDWGRSHEHTMALRLHGNEKQGACLLLMNANAHANTFVLPALPAEWGAQSAAHWVRQIDSHSASIVGTPVPATVEVPAGAVWLLTPSQAASATVAHVSNQSTGVQS